MTDTTDMTDMTDNNAMVADPSAQDFLENLEDLGHASAESDLADGLEAVHDVPVRVQAVLGRSRMPIGELLRLQTGMVIELDRKVGEPVDIFVNDRLIARGEVVLIDESLGVTLTEIVQSEK